MSETSWWVRFIWGNVSRISPEAPVPVVDVQKDNIMLGGCANVLNNIHAIGGRVYVAGVIGSDMIGKKLLAELRGKKLKPEVLWKRDVPQHSKPIVAHGQQMVRFDKEHRKPIPASGADKILTYVKSLRDKNRRYRYFRL